MCTLCQKLGGANIHPKSLLAIYTYSISGALRVLPETQAAITRLTGTRLGPVAQAAAVKVQNESRSSRHSRLGNNEDMDRPLKSPMVHYLGLRVEFLQKII